MGYSGHPRIVVGPTARIKRVATPPAEPLSGVPKPARGRIESRVRSRTTGTLPRRTQSKPPLRSIHESASHHLKPKMGVRVAAQEARDFWRSVVEWTLSEGQPISFPKVLDSGEDVPRPQLSGFMVRSVGELKGQIADWRASLQDDPRGFHAVNMGTDTSVTSTVGTRLRVPGRSLGRRQPRDACSRDWGGSFGDRSHIVLPLTQGRRFRLARGGN